MDVVQQVEQFLHIVLTSYIVCLSMFHATARHFFFTLQAKQMQIHPPTARIKHADLPKGVVEVKIHCSLAVLCKVIELLQGVFFNWCQLVSEF